MSDHRTSMASVYDLFVEGDTLIVLRQDERIVLYYKIFMV